MKIWERIIAYDANTKINYIKSEGENTQFNVLHSHEDYEIRLIISGKASCMIGGQIIDYKKHDIHFIGKNTPHIPVLLQTKKNVKSIILHFHSVLFPENIDELPDYVHIAKVLKEGQAGLVYTKKTLGAEIEKILNEMDGKTGITKVNRLLHILELLGKSQPKMVIVKQEKEALEKQSRNLEVVSLTRDFLHQNMQRELSLSDIAQAVHTSSTNLCRVFKRNMQLTVFEYLNRIRIENVCRLLLHSELSISEIAYVSGFNNMAYFNRRFKEIMKISPSEFRKNKTNIL